MKRNFLILFLLSITFAGISQITVSLPALAVSQGSTISVPVILSGASETGSPISAADIRFTFDPAVLTFTGFTNFYTSMPSSQWFYSGNNTTGLVSANWIEPSLLTLSVPDGTTLYEVNFTYNGGNSPLHFSFTEFTDASYNTILTIPVDGNVGPDSKVLNLTFLIQGLYDGVSSMIQSQDENGNHFSGNTAEQVTIELHSAASYSTIEYSATAIEVSTSGNATVNLPGSISGSYYVTVKSRNCVETTTSAPISFSSPVTSYDFTDAASKAFGDNMILINGVYCFYSGDVGGDGIIDSSDMIPVDNMVSAFATGYLPEDINGDGLLDSTDMITVDNNASAFISSVIPF